MPTIKISRPIIVLITLSLFGCINLQEKQNHTESKNTDLKVTNSSHPKLSNAEIDELKQFIMQHQPETIFNAHDEMIPKVIEAFKSGDKAVIAATVHYPFEMRQPVPNIKNQTQMLERFDEVFDDKFIQEVANSTLADWRTMGSKGIMFKNGAIWATESGKLFRIRANTAAAQAVYEKTLQANRMTLHPSLRQFKEVKIEWTLERFKIRIDDMGDKGYRYAAWPSHKSQLEKPDIILHNGTVHYEGSAGNHNYEFVNGKYHYSVYVGHSEDDSSGSLGVSKGDSSIFFEKYYNNNVKSTCRCKTRSE